MSGELQRPRTDADQPQESLPSQSIPPQMLERMLDNQARELQLRAEELGLQEQKDTNAFEFGKEALTAKLADRKDQRKHEMSMRRDACILTAFITLLIIALIGYALFSKSEAFATELIKSIVLVLTGGAGGYGLAKARASRSGRSANDSDDE